MGEKCFCHLNGIAVKDATARKILKGCVTPQLYGAVGDGVTDDTEAINKALTSGTDVYFPTANYLVDAETMLQVKSNTHIDLGGSTIICKTNSVETYYIFYLKDCENVVIENGIIIGDRETHTGTTGEWGHGIRLENAHNVILRNLTVNKCWGDGCVISAGSTHITVDTCKFDYNRRQGITVGDCKYVNIINSYFANTSGTNPQAGIDVEPNANENASHIMICNNIFENNTGSGIQANGGEDYSRVTDLIIKCNLFMGNSESDLNGLGINFSFVKNATIIDNNFYNIKNTPIQIAHCINNSILNNVIEECEFLRMIYIHTSDNTKIQNNIIRNSNSQYIIFITMSKHCVLSGNTISHIGVIDDTIESIVFFLTGDYNDQDGSCNNVINSNTFIEINFKLFGNLSRNSKNNCFSNNDCHENTFEYLVRTNGHCFDTRVINNIMSSGTNGNFVGADYTTTGFYGTTLNNIIDFALV